MAKLVMKIAFLVSFLGLVLTASSSASYASGGLLKLFAKLFEAGDSVSVIAAKTIPKLKPMFKAIEILPGEVIATSRTILNGGYPDLRKLQKEYQERYGFDLRGSCLRRELDSKVKSLGEEVESIFEAYEDGELPEELIELHVNTLLSETISAFSSHKGFAGAFMKSLPISVNVSGSSVEIDVKLPCGYSLSSLTNSSWPLFPGTMKESVSFAPQFAVGYEVTRTIRFRGNLSYSLDDAVILARQETKKGGVYMVLHCNTGACAANEWYLMIPKYRNLFTKYAQKNGYQKISLSYVFGISDDANAAGALFFTKGNVVRNEKGQISNSLEALLDTYYADQKS